MNVFILKRFSTCFHYAPAGWPPHLCLSFFSSVFLAVIRKPSITDSLGVWKLLRGVDRVIEQRTESESLVISLLQFERPSVTILAWIIIFIRVCE